MGDHINRRRMSRKRPGRAASYAPASLRWADAFTDTELTLKREKSRRQRRG